MFSKEMETYLKDWPFRNYFESVWRDSERYIGKANNLSFAVPRDCWNSWLAYAIEE